MLRMMRQLGLPPATQLSCRLPAAGDSDAALVAASVGQCQTDLRPGSGRAGQRVLQHVQMLDQLCKGQTMTGFLGTSSELLHFTGPRLCEPMAIPYNLPG